MDLEILSKKLIKPSSPTPPHLTTLSLSPLDLIVPRVYMAAVGYYPAPGRSNHAIFEDRMIRNSMERSLSENLTIFYPFAGRYDDTRQIIECNDQGVEYVEARVANCDLAGVLYGKAEAKLLERLVPEGEESPMTPLLLIQVNVFECGGVAVGIRFSHRIADAMTVSSFVNGWATACQGGVENIIHPSFDLGYIFPSKKESWIKPYSPWKNEPSNIVTKRFVFNKASISSLRATAGASRVILVTALLWKTLMRGKNGSFLTHILNMRNRTHVPVPGNICGNFWRCANTRSTGAGDADLELEELIGLLSGSIKKSAAESAKAMDGDELVREAGAALMELCRESEQENAEFRVFTSWCRFPMYQADFGWGRPIWVSSVHLPVRITVLIDSYDGEGVEAWVSLEESEMDRLEQDPHFRAFTS